MPTFKRQDQEQIEKAQDLLEGAPVGEIGFTKSLFFGRLHLDKVMPYPKQDPEESARVDNLLRDLEAFLTAHVDPERIDREERISQDVIDGLGKLGDHVLRDALFAVNALGVNVGGQEGQEVAEQVIDARGF